MNIQPTPFDGLVLIEPVASHDVRGMERTGFHPTQYAAFGLTGRFASDRYIRSFQGSIRGLYILPHDQCLLFTLVRGDACVAVVDTRQGSKTFGRVHMIDLNESNNRQIYIPGGMAYGVCVRSDNADIHEKFTGLYDPIAILGLFWNDADLDIAWPVKFPLVSDTENRFPAFRAVFPVFA